MAFPTFAGLYPQSYTYRDAKGFTSVLHYLIQWDAGDQDNGAAFALALSTAISALTNAHLTAAHGIYGAIGQAQYGVDATAGSYESVVQKAVMVFQDSGGALHHFTIPAPKNDSVNGIFLADKETVNPANTHVQAYVTQMITADTNGVFAATRSNLPFVAFFGGYFKAAKIRRKFNVLTLTPGLTPEEPGE